LAKRFGFLALPAFSARVTVDRQIGGQVVVEGRLGRKSGGGFYDWPSE